MIQKLQKLFHTEKKIGRVLFGILLYIVYWIIFYIIIPFLIILIQNFNFGGVVLISFLVIIAPIISFYIPKTLSKISKVNKYILYSIHIILIILPLIIYTLLILLAIRNGLSHMSI